MIKNIFVAVAIVSMLNTAVNADIVWLGTTDNDIFNEANWDLSSSSVTIIDPNVSVEDNAVIGPGPFANDPVILEQPSQQRFQLGDGNTLTLSGSTLTVAGNDGVGGAPGTTNGPLVNVIDGGQFDPFFVVNDVQVNIDATSSATFGGGGNPINLSAVDLTPGAMLGFLNETPDAYRAEHLSKTTVLGAPAIEGDNVMIAAMGAGSKITVIPEPTSMILTSFGMLALLSFRRKVAGSSETSC